MACMSATKTSKNQRGVTASLPSSNAPHVAHAIRALTTPINIIPAKIFQNSLSESDAVVARTPIACNHPTNTEIHFSKKFDPRKSKA